MSEDNNTPEIRTKDQGTDIRRIRQDIRSSMDSLITRIREAMQRIKAGQEKTRMALGRDLATVSTTVSTLLASVDPHFLKLGEKLNETYCASGQLSGLVLKTLSLEDAGENKTRLKDIRTVSDSVVQTLRSARENILTHLTHLSSAITHLESLCKACSQTDRLSMLLNVITLNIAVESRRSREAGRMFEVFVKEIGQLAHKIKSVSTGLSEDAEKEKQYQQSCQKDLKQKLSTLTRLMGESEKTVEESTTATRDLIQHSFQSLEKANSHSAVISEKISEMVMAIQFHDIVRQKLEHVIAVLDEILPGNKSHDPETMATVFSGVKIQKAQILGVVSEIREAHNHITDAFHTIDQEAQALAQCLLNAGIQKNQASETDLFSEAISGMTQLTSLISKAGDLGRQMEEAVATASGSIKKLARHVRIVEEISLDLHRKALNAVIKSASLGDTGLSLEVLAQEVTQTSRALDDFTVTITQIIQAVSDTADKTGWKTSGLDESHDLLHTAIQDISKDYDLFRENSAAAQIPAENFTHLLAWADSHLSFIPEFAEALETQCKKLDEILSGMSEYDISSFEKLPDASIYTMESERLIHSSVISKAPETPPPPEIENPPKDKEEDSESLGDNIDLF